jgi:hypothetical protein
MNKIKYTAFLVLAVFLGGIFSSAAAQKASTPGFIGPPTWEVKPLSGPYTVRTESIAVSKFDLNPDSGAPYRLSWSNKMIGDLSGFMFVSVNYSTPMYLRGGAQVTGIGGTSNVIDGSWTKLIFVNNVYVGSVSGTITGGELTWSETDQNTAIRLDLTSDQGSDAFTGCYGRGTFEGTWNQEAEGMPISGTLNFTY